MAGVRGVDGGGGGGRPHNTDDDEADDPSPLLYCCLGVVLYCHDGTDDPSLSIFEK